MKALFRDITTGFPAAVGTSVPIQIPSGTLPGDYLVLSLTLGTATTQTFSFLTVVGWQFQGTSVNTGGIQTSIFTRFAKAGDAGQTVTVVWQTSTTAGAAMGAYGGVDQKNPVACIGTGVNSGLSAQVHYGTPIPAVDATLIATGWAYTAAPINNGFSSLSFTLRAGGGLGGATSPTGQISFYDCYGDTYWEYANNLVIPSGFGELTANAAGAVLCSGMSIGLRPATVPLVRSSFVSNFSLGTSFALSQQSISYVANSDFALAFIFLNGTSSTLTLPSGWTRAQSAQTSITNNCTLEVIYKFLTPADVSAAQTGAWAPMSLSSSTSGSYRLLFCSGVDPANPIDAIATTFSASSPLTSSPSVTLTHAGDLLISSYTTLTGGSTASIYPPGTENQNGSVTNACVDVFWETWAPSGATGPRAVTFNTTHGSYANTTVGLKAIRSPFLRAATTPKTSTGDIWLKTSPWLGMDTASVTIPCPASVTSGDRLVTAFHIQGTQPAPAITTPAGWSLLTEVDGQPGSNSTLRVYTKTAGTEPSSYVWSWTAQAAGLYTLGAGMVAIGSTLGLDVFGSNAISGTTQPVFNAATPTTIYKGELILYIGSSGFSFSSYPPVVTGSKPVVTLLSDAGQHALSMSYEIHSTTDPTPTGSLATDNYPTSFTSTYKPGVGNQIVMIL